MAISKDQAAAYWTLRIGFGLAIIVAGCDKFTNLLTDWSKYLNPSVLTSSPVGAHQLMEVIGIVEIFVGLMLLAGATRVFGYIAALWLFAIAANLITMGAFYDIAVRDILLGLTMYSLARLTDAREKVTLVTETEEHRRAA
jgi:uncharacterized membrane protein YphA (DoxX/SURF4 family)